MKYLLLVRICAINCFLSFTVDFLKPTRHFPCGKLGQVLGLAFKYLVSTAQVFYVTLKGFI